MVEYELEGVTDAEPIYRVITTILDPKKAPAHELAALYHERWEIEIAFDEFETHLRGGADIVLRSKRPDLVIQELYGLLLRSGALPAGSRSNTGARRHEPARRSQSVSSPNEQY